MVYLFLVLFLLMPASAAAQLAPEQLLDIHRIYEPQFSSDARFVSFTVSEPNKGAPPNRDVWILERESRNLRRLTYTAKADYQPKWHPHKNELAFLSNRDGSTRIYLLDMTGGEAAVLTDDKINIESYEWSPDGKQIAYLAQEPLTAEQEQKEKDKDDAFLVDRDDRLARVWILDVETKKSRKLTHGQWRISEMKWLPSGDKLIVIATDQPESDRFTDRIFSIPISNGEFSLVAEAKGPLSSLAVSPDGKNLAYIAARVDGPVSHDIYIQPVKGGPARNITGKSIDRPIADFSWINHESFMALVEDGFKTRFFQISSEGTSKPVLLPGQEGNASTFAYGAKGAMVFVAQSTTKMPELCFYDGKKNVETVSHFNQSWNKISLAIPEFIKFKSFDDKEIEGSLLKPPNYKSGTLPLIVLVHGGPTGRWQDSFESWGQLLASHGYAVFYPNIRGSTGYGWQFLESNRADWGGSDFKDILAGIDFLIQRGDADADRLGIGGWSYGGFMGMWAITQTHRFKASVAGAGLSDIASEYGTEEEPAYDEWFFGLPYENIDPFLKCSPITYVKNARTPTLLLQGEEDTVDPIGQSQQFYRALKRYGVKSDFVLYPREGHGVREEKHQLDIFRRIVAWYDRFVKPDQP